MVKKEESNKQVEARGIKKDELCVCLFAARLRVTNGVTKISWRAHEKKDFQDSVARDEVRKVKFTPQIRYKL